MPTARSKVWIEKDGKPLIGKGRAELLEEIARTGSIRQAASRIGLSYRHAWGMVSKVGKAAGSPVVISTRGGRQGGRSVLTEEGRELLAEYRRAEAGRSIAGFGSVERIRCRVVKVDRSKRLVILRSAGEGGDLVVTVRGGNLSRGLSRDDEIILMRSQQGSRSKACHYVQQLPEV